MPKREAEQETTAFKEEFQESGKRRKQQQPRRKVALYKAIVEKSDSGSAGTSVATNDAAILKIRKCLERGNHPDTPEKEAKVALHVASRWMATYNVSQAQIYAQEKAADSSRHGGKCEVSIQRSDEDRQKPVKMQGHVNDMCHAVKTLFDCKFYSTGRTRSITITFYGIEANAMTAANAFEMIFNLVAEWSLRYKGNGPRESYCLGISTELCDIAARAKRMEEVESKQAEITVRIKEEAREVAEEQARLSRLSVPLAPESERPCDSPLSGHHDPHDSISDQDGEVSHDEDDPVSRENIEDEDEDNFFEPTFAIEDGDDVGPDIHADLDETIEKLVKHEPQSPDEEKSWLPNLDSSDPLSSMQLDAVGWTSHSQLVLFRDKADAIADEFIKSKEIKLRSGRKSTCKVRDWDVYYQGKRDGHKIDMRGNTKRIEASKDTVIKKEDA